MDKDKKIKLSAQVACAKGAFLSVSTICDTFF